MSPRNPGETVRQGRRDKGTQSMNDANEIEYQMDHEGHVYNGYDYTLQVWVRNGKVQPCSHPRAMRCGCMADKHKHQHIARARAEEGLK